MNLELSTRELQQGDIVHLYGMRLLLVDQAAYYAKGELIRYRGKVLNPNEITDHRIAHYIHNGEDVTGGPWWTIQALPAKRWEVERHELVKVWYEPLNAGYRASCSCGKACRAKPSGAIAVSVIEHHINKMKTPKGSK